MELGDWYHLGCLEIFRCITKPWYFEDMLKVYYQSDHTRKFWPLKSTVMLVSKYRRQQKEYFEDSLATQNDNYAVNN